MNRTHSTMFRDTRIGVSADWAQASCLVSGVDGGRPVSDFRHSAGLDEFLKTYSIVDINSADAALDCGCLSSANEFCCYCYFAGEAALRAALLQCAECASMDLDASATIALIKTALENSRVHAVIMICMTSSPRHDWSPDWSPE